MSVCNSELIAILITVLVFFGENGLCMLNSSSPISTSTFDTSSNVTTENVLAISKIQPFVHLASDNQTETSVSEAQLGVGNKTILAVNSANSSNAAVNGDSNIQTNVTSEGHKKPVNFFHNKGAMLRAFYVAVGILVIITIYTFVISRLKRRNTKRHMYGLLTKHTDVELTPLGQDEEEEEHTVFDAVQYKS